MGKLGNREGIPTAKMMINTNEIDFDINKISMCKCQNCNIIKLDSKVLTKKDIDKMFLRLIK